MRRIAQASLIVIFLAACGSAVATTAEQGVATGATISHPSAVPPATEIPPTNQAAQPTTTEPSAAPAIPDDAVDAPDFTLPLGDGTSYTLSEDTKPVYLVFWAEW